jgi:hypothetical protein
MCAAHPVFCRGRVGPPPRPCRRPPWWAGSCSTVALPVVVGVLALAGTPSKRVRWFDSLPYPPWEEKTSPTGYYRGAVYRGAIQLLVEAGGRMTARWLGFGKHFQINNGDWSLRLESRSVTPQNMAEFSGRP